MAARDTSPARPAGLGAAWAVLLGMGGTSVTYNVYHAVHHGQLNLWLALLYGIAAVFAAAMLSHIVAVVNSGWVMKTITYLVMLGAMTLSIGATASVVAPAAGPWMRWLFGIVLDAAALLALRVILESRRRQATSVTALAEARAAAEQAHAEAVAASATAARLQTELDTAQADLDAERRRTQAAPAGASAAVVSMVPRAHPARTSGAPAARTPGTSQTVPGSAPDPLVEYAAEIAVGEVPSVRRIKAEMNVGQKRAQEIQAEL